MEITGYEVVHSQWVAAASKALADRYPLASRVQVGDAGKEDHCSRIAKDTGSAWVEMPAGSPSNFDANDLHQRDGLDALAALLANPKEHPQRFRLLAPSELAALPQSAGCVGGVLALDTLMGYGAIAERVEMPKSTVQSICNGSRRGKWATRWKSVPDASG